MNRRNFIRTASALSAITIGKPGAAFSTKHNSSVRMGFIGCGSRGSSVISSMSATSNINIIGLADIFEDKLKRGWETANGLNEKKGFAHVSGKNAHVGPNAYLRLLENRDIDAVLISTPAYSHPDIVEAAIAAGKHVYCEKPVAIDVEGCQRIARMGKDVEGKLSLASGFQIRYATPWVELVQRIKRGEIGEINSVQLYYFSSSIPIAPCEGMSNDECRIRNHFQYNELSGGILLDQAIHMIDVCNWALESRPVYAIGMGGAKSRPLTGNAWNNFEVIYKYPNDINVSIHSTQLGKVFGDVGARFVGTEGIAEANYAGGTFIIGKNEWDSGILSAASGLSPEDIARGAKVSSLHDADQNKGKSFIESIESGKYINQLATASESTLSAILGREAALKEEKVMWDEMIFNSQKIESNLNLKQFEI